MNRGTMIALGAAGAAALGFVLLRKRSSSPSSAKATRFPNGQVQTVVGAEPANPVRLVTSVKVHKPTARNGATKVNRRDHTT